MFLHLSVSHSIPSCNGHGVCISACNGGVCLWAQGRMQTTPGQTSLGRHPLPEPATEAGGQHPTGMHSCLHFHSQFSSVIPPFKCYSSAFNRPQRSWGKVMFLQVSVILFTGGVPDQVHPPRTRYTPLDQVYPPDQVRILLECNLVFF